MQASDTSSESSANPQPAIAASQAAGEDDLPPESAIFCEDCGYRLDGLPATGNCPECGTPVALSTTDHRRHLAPFEQQRGLTAYARTAGRILLRPGGFFRTLRTRVEADQHDAASRFCWITLLLAGLAGGVALVLHLGWTGVLIHVGFWPPLVAMFAMVAGVLATRLVLRLVVQLTVYEARFRKMRLPRPTVARAMHYHTAHLLPVALLFLIASGMYRWAQSQSWINPLAVVEPYIGVLVVLVVAGGAYLFLTYWAAMRNMLHANA